MGCLEVITGPMFSGKSTELIRRLRRAQIAGKKVVLVRPEIDHTRLTHDIDKVDFAVLRTSKLETLMWSWVTQPDVIGIDEVQFLENPLPWILHQVKFGQHIIVAGLDTTFAYKPFGQMPELLAYAERVDKLTAVCVKCGNDATRTQRIINGEPAKLSDPVILVGEEDFYEARCAACWELKQEA